MTDPLPILKRSKSWSRSSVTSRGGRPGCRWGPARGPRSGPPGRAPRRAGGENLPAAVIDYVGQVRSLNDRAAETIDPGIAERVIMATLGHGSLSDVNGRQVRQAQNLLLPLLVRDEQPDDARLDEILASARALIQA